MSNPHGLFVQFYTDAVQNNAKSREAGRPIFEDVPFIRKMVPGDQSNVIERVAKDHDKMQFPREWEIFKSQQVQGVVGTPLEQWPQVTRAQVKEAKYYEVHSVEQLSELSDLACNKMGMGFFELRGKAKAYLEASSATAKETAQAEENARLRSEMEALKAQIAAVSADAPKRGRKAKDEPEAEQTE